MISIHSGAKYVRLRNMMITTKSANQQNKRARAETPTWPVLPGYNGKPVVLIASQVENWAASSGNCSAASHMAIDFICLVETIPI